MSINQHLSSSVLMIRPIDFVYNEQTAVDNEFMSAGSSSESKETIRDAAVREFDAAAELLRSRGINVIIFDKSIKGGLSEVITPDAVFPNNWISTEPSGKVILYPMFASNRSAEKHQFSYVAELLLQAGHSISSIDNFQHNNQVLEGTGSLIIDRVKQRVYATISQRCQAEIFNEWGKTYNYEPVLFESVSSTGKPVYHTNIVMSIGETFAVINKESIVGEARANEVVSKLAEDREIILISTEQTEKHLCGNILQVLDKTTSKKFIVMSSTAFNGFTDEQKATLNKHGEIIHFPIPTIERIGGGSARCMLAEINLPRK